MSRLLHHLLNSFVTVVPRKQLQAYPACSAASPAILNHQETDSAHPFRLVEKKVVRVRAADIWQFASTQNVTFESVPIREAIATGLYRFDPSVRSCSI
jgi:hypothetical protein